MPDQYAASPRTLLGKNVARMRKEGIVPANVFGRGLESAPIQLATKDARELLKVHGPNTLVNLQIEGETAPAPSSCATSSASPSATTCSTSTSTRWTCSERSRRTCPSSSSAPRRRCRPTVAYS